MNTLIADAGSTKVNWTLIDSEGSILKSHSSEGLNALLAEADYVRQYLQQVGLSIGHHGGINRVFYYGAGCATERVCARMTDLLQDQWGEAEVHVASDLLGAARSLFGDKRGIACILGTGSNSCLYSGEAIEENVPSLGYILGDEGSGAALGKRFVSDLYKGQLPEKVRQDFMEQYTYSLSDILDNVYRSSTPGKFLASLVPFLKDHLWNPYIYDLVRREFSKFAKRNVSMYSGARRLKVGFVGSLAFHFESVLREAFDAQGLDIDIIVSDPMPGLIEYHASH